MARATSTVIAGSQTPPATPERRRSLRKRVLWSGHVAAAETPIRCAVVDVSLRGVRVRLDEGTLPQGPLALAVSRFGTFQAEVVWIQDKMAGLRFLESIEHVADTIGRQLPLAA